MIIGVDPGVRGCGCAVFMDRVLFRAAFVKSPVTAGNGAAACVAMGLAVTEWVRALRLPLEGTLVLEWPRVLLASHQKGAKRGADPNDLLALVGVDCTIATALCETMKIESVEPSVWKSGEKNGRHVSIDKEVMCHRIWGRLSEEERKNVERTPRGGGLHFDGYEGGFQHDVIDACGVAMWQIGRLTRRRVFG